MKLNLKKTALVNLSNDDKLLPCELTPQVAGGDIDLKTLVCHSVNFACASLDILCASVDVCIPNPNPGR